MSAGCYGLVQEKIVKVAAVSVADVPDSQMYVRFQLRELLNQASVVVVRIRLRKLEVQQ